MGQWMDQPWTCFAKAPLHIINAVDKICMNRHLAHSVLACLAPDTEPGRGKPGRGGADNRGEDCVFHMRMMKI